MRKTELGLSEVDESEAASVQRFTGYPLWQLAAKQVAEGRGECSSAECGLTSAYPMTDLRPGERGFVAGRLYSEHELIIRCMQSAQCPNMDGVRRTRESAVAIVDRCVEANQQMWPAADETDTELATRQEFIGKHIRQEFGIEALTAE